MLFTIREDFICPSKGIIDFFDKRLYNFPLSVRVSPLILCSFVVETNPHGSLRDIAIRVLTTSLVASLRKLQKQPNQKQLKSFLITLGIFDTKPQ